MDRPILKLWSTMKKMKPVFFREAAAYILTKKQSTAVIQSALVDFALADTDWLAGGGCDVAATDWSTGRRHHSSRPSAVFIRVRIPGFSSLTGTSNSLKQNSVCREIRLEARTYATQSQLSSPTNI